MVILVVGRGGRALQEEEAELSANVPARTSPPAGVCGSDGLLPLVCFVELHCFAGASGLERRGGPGERRGGEEMRGEGGFWCARWPNG